MIGSKQDWLNLNSLRSYPLEYSTNPVAESGFVVPDSLIVECMAVAQADSFAPVLSSVHLSGTLVSVVFFDTVSNQDVFMAQTSLTNDYTEAQVVSLGSIDVSGSIIFGEISSLTPWIRSGIHRLPKTSNSLSTHCFMTAGAQVVSSMSAGVEQLIGDITLITQGSLVASVSEQLVNGVMQYSIVLYLSDPANYLGTCQPAKSLCNCLFDAIEYINTVPADRYGNINIVADPALGLEITTLPGSIIISLPQSGASACGTTQKLPFSDGRLPSEYNLAP